MHKTVLCLRFIQVTRLFNITLHFILLIHLISLILPYLDLFSTISITQNTSRSLQIITATVNNVESCCIVIIQFYHRKINLLFHELQTVQEILIFFLGAFHAPNNINLHYLRNVMYTKYVFLFQKHVLSICQCINSRYILALIKGILYYIVNCTFD